MSNNFIVFLVCICFNQCQQLFIAGHPLMYIFIIMWDPFFSIHNMISSKMLILFHVYRMSPLTARRIGSRPGSLPVISKTHNAEPIPVSSSYLWRVCQLLCWCCNTLILWEWLLKLYFPVKLNIFANHILNIIMMKNPAQIENNQRIHATNLITSYLVLQHLFMFI